MKKIIIVLVLLNFLFSFIFPQQLIMSNYLSPEEQNMLMIRINVWGNVRQPGSILVPDGTDLITAISFAGGPTSKANTRSIIIIDSQGNRRKCNINNYRDNDRKNNPIMQPGETIIVPVNFWHVFTEGIGFIYRIAVILYTVFQVWDLANTYF